MKQHLVLPFVSATLFLTGCASLGFEQSSSSDSQGLLVEAAAATVSVESTVSPRALYTRRGNITDNDSEISPVPQDARDQEARHNNDVGQWYQSAIEQSVAKMRINVLPTERQLDAEINAPVNSTDNPSLASAHFNRGYMYRTGDGAVQDNEEAAKWYRLAAEQGDARAQFGLGIMYRKGEGVAQDNSEAAKWYQRAAEQGVTNAQTNLGLMYYQGVGVKRDPVMAYMLHLVADKNGASQARQVQRMLKNELTNSQLAKAEALAEQWEEGTALPEPKVSATDSQRSSKENA